MGPRMKLRPAQDSHGRPAGHHDSRIEGRYLPAERVFRLSLGFMAAACLAFIATYLWRGQPHLILWIVIPYLLPTAVTWFSLKRWNLERVASVYLFGLFTETIGLRLLCEPTYLVDFISLPSWIAMAFFSVSPRRAIGLTLYLLGGLLAASLSVHLFHPFPVLYTNAGLPGSIWISVASTFAILTVCFSAYIGEVQELLSSLNHKSQDVESINQDYRNLLGVVIHDFANDLQVTRMALDTVLDEEIKSDAQLRNVSLKRAEQSLGNLEDILSNLKRLNQTIGSTCLTRAKAVPIQSLIDKAEFVFRDSLRSKRVEFKTQVDAADFGKLEVMVEPVTFSVHIFNNLISNAVKFAPEGTEILLGARLEQGRLWIQIANRGASVAPDHFERLLRGSVPVGVPGIGSSGEIGQGIGLSIVRRFCENMQIELRGKVTPLEGDFAMTSVEIGVPAAIAVQPIVV